MSIDCPEAEEIEQKHPGALDEIAEEITEHLWDRDRISEAEEGEDGYVFIADIVQMNACNHAFTGTFWLGGVEYSFGAENGDWNGWVWREISADKPVPEIDYKPTTWALQPIDSLISKAIEKGQGKFLVLKWDEIASREPYKSLPGKYGYDRHFQPGLKVERYWKNKAAEGRFKLVDQETADETRKRLLAKDANQ
ncbi:hypothetical protein [Roseovarius sp. MMSF_3281]|uniref:hypothetical protein n=1 Tax=Roseovarius sp. MMSF_3281 TaxID=3046694 RepID=UPI00273DD818|nr:hypothetical protein [Roseovarius sp. MMSF_3281]